MTNYRPGVRVSLTVLGLSWLIPAVAGERIHFDEEGYEARPVRSLCARRESAPDGSEGWKPDSRLAPSLQAWTFGNHRIHPDERGRVSLQAHLRQQHGKYLVINPGICKGPRKIPGRLARAMATLPDIAKYASSVNSCGTFDGGGADVEGIVDGKHFQFTAMNPHDCDEARPLAEMLDLIVAAYEKDRD